MAKKSPLTAPNYAKDRVWAQQFGMNKVQEWQTIRSERAERESRWKDGYDVWSLGNQDVKEHRNYFGRANLNFPQIRKEVETMTRRLTKAMFPEDYLRASSDINATQALADTNTHVVRHFFDKVIHLKAKVHPWLKQNVIYGTSPLRSFWHKEVNEIIYKKRMFKEGPDGQLIPDFKRVKELVTLYNAPKIQTADLLQTWVYPVTASDPSEIERVYFRTKVTFEYLKEREKLGLYIPVDFLENEGKEKDDHFEETQEKLAAMGESGVLMGKGKGRYYDLLEVWGREDIDGTVIPYVCEIINETHNIRVQQNPFWHQSPPFDFARFIIPPGNEFYGRGLPEASISLQHQLDDVLNQGMDSTTLSLNQITIVNPAFAPNAESFEIEPNAIWWADPQGVKPFTFPDLSDTYMKNAAHLRSAITEMSDNQPQLPDPIAGKARSTGQAQLAINEWQTDLFSFVDNIIIEGLQPLSQKVHSLLQQNLPDDAIFRIAGKYAGNWVNRVVTPQDIVGNYKFEWLGAIQVENQSVKTQQMLNLLKILPMIPGEAGIKLKWENYILKLLRDGFQIRDVENIIESTNVSNSVPAYIENKILMQGGEVEVSSGDDDDLHIKEHMRSKGETADLYIKALHDIHIVKHQEQKTRKAAQAAAQQAMLQAMQMSNAQNNGGGQKKPGAQGPNPNGNQGQLSQSTNPADLERGLR